MNNDLKARYIKARRAYIRSYYTQLNEKQLDAVCKVSGPLLLLAGAGSGKTTVLIQRISNILRFGIGSETDIIPEYIQESDVAILEQAVSSSIKSERADMLCKYRVPYPSNIIAITFTNKAANELKERLLKDIGDEACDIWAMTFHSACCRILRKEIDRLGYHSNFTIYDSSDSERVMKDVLEELNLDEKTFPPKLMLSFINRAKEQMQDPHMFEASLSAQSDFRMEIAAKCYTNYQNRLINANAVDFDDIIFLTVLLLQQYPEVRQYYAHKFQYVLVDEYQDTNHAQYQLTSLLASEHGNICVVGDDDQSIYKFRGATIRNILEFEDQYKGTETIRLEQNYRSTKAILEAANSVISNNRSRKGKKLWTDNIKGEAVIVHESGNEYQEADYLASQIFKLSREQGYKSCAVLYRTNIQSNVIERTFASNGIPYRIFGGLRFFDRAEIKDILAYLMVINNPSDDLRLKRIINNPARGIGAKSLDTAERLAEALHESLFDILENADVYPSLEKAASKFKPFVSMIRELQERSETLSLPDFYDCVLEKTGYLAMLEEKQIVEFRTKAENVRELRSNFVQFTESNDNPKLADFLEEISLYTDLEKYNQDDDAVTMMTIHSAKGLEFKNVFLVGMEDGLFPSSRSMDESEDLEEERRLCYVAITRAQERLYLSYADQRMLYGRTAPTVLSRFIKELPESCVFENTAKKNKFNGYDGFNFSDNNYHVSHSYSKNGNNSSGTGYCFKQRSDSVNKQPETGMVVKVNYQPGNMVEHRSFGKGMVISVIKMGNDCLLEIAFDKFGTKKLMANSAATHMKRL